MKRGAWLIAAMLGAMLGASGLNRVPGLPLRHIAAHSLAKIRAAAASGVR